MSDQDLQNKYFLGFLENETISWYEDQTLITDPSDISLPNWDVKLARNDELEFINVLGQQVNGVGLTFTLTRMMTFHLMQTFLPSSMIMMASVLSVFVPAHYVPGRVALCITAFLAMISLINGARLLNCWSEYTVEFKL